MRLSLFKLILYTTIKVTYLYHRHEQVVFTIQGSIVNITVKHTSPKTYLELNQGTFTLHLLRETLYSAETLDKLGNLWQNEHLVTQLPHNIFDKKKIIS